MAHSRVRRSPEGEVASWAVRSSHHQTTHEAAVNIRPLSVHADRRKVGVRPDEERAAMNAVLDDVWRPTRGLSHVCVFRWSRSRNWIFPLGILAGLIGL